MASPTAATSGDLPARSGDAPSDDSGIDGKSRRPSFQEEPELKRRAFSSCPCGFLGLVPPGREECDIHPRKESIVQATVTPDGTAVRVTRKDHLTEPEADEYDNTDNPTAPFRPWWAKTPDQFAHGHGTTPMIRRLLEQLDRLAPGAQLLFAIHLLHKTAVSPNAPLPAPLPVPAIPADDAQDPMPSAVSEFDLNAAEDR